VTRRVVQLTRRKCTHYVWHGLNDAQKDDLLLDVHGEGALFSVPRSLLGNDRVTSCVGRVTGA
jgi:hypothetical protein